MLATKRVILPLPAQPSGPAYYNECDPGAARALRSMITAGLIAKGDVDERSIEDVRPEELTRYRQRHFFAGWGVWSYAARLAGWPDDEPIVTMSCPCQPFSSAGTQRGFADERHLWPAGLHQLVGGEPCPVFGEQVASKAGLAWLDVVLSDLEAEGYAAGALDLCSAGVGAPHVRQRLYWMADPNGRACSGQHTTDRGAGVLANADGKRRTSRNHGGRRPPDHASSPSEACDRRPTNGFWKDADWLSCGDGKARPVEPGSFPMAYGLPTSVRTLPAGLQRLAAVAELDGKSLARAKNFRVTALKLAGNAVNAQLTALFLKEAREVILTL